MTSTCRRAVLAIVVTSVLVAEMIAALDAHPGSTTTVAINVRPANTVDVTIVSDAQALVTKLEVESVIPSTVAGRDVRLREAAADWPRPTSEAVSPTALSSQLTTLSATLVEKVDLQCDGTPVLLTVERVSVDANAEATIHLIGAMPPGARSLTWATALVYGTYPVAVRARGHDAVRWLQGRETSEAFALDAGSQRSFSRGVWLGFTHIVPHGLDHILFVLGLLLLSTRLRELLLQVSAFTLAHSMTLGLCLHGVVSLPSRVVEPLIALSVAYVGLERLISSRLQPWRVAIVFAFGLLHGLGFAEAVAGLNLSREDLMATLVSFNVGVELGQLTVIAGAAAMIYAALRARHARWRRPVIQLASAGVGIAGMIWTIERVFT